MHKLTERENKIMHLYAYGYSEKEIAKELNISLSRVNLYVYNIYKKLKEKHQQNKELETASL